MKIFPYRYWPRLVLLGAIGSCISLFVRPAHAETFLDVGQFRGDVETRILNRTKALLKDGYGKKSVVRFAVFRDGSLHNLRISRHSDSVKHDALALETVKACAPFSPIPADGPPVEEFSIEINYNAHTWESHCDPAGPGPELDRFLCRLAHQWEPRSRKSFDSLALKFTVDSQGAIVDAALAQYPPYSQWLAALPELLYAQSMVLKAKSCLDNVRIFQGTNVDSLTVMCFYDPRPINGTVQHRLIGTDCGPAHSDYADATIEFYDPP